MSKGKYFCSFKISHFALVVYLFMPPLLGVGGVMFPVLMSPSGGRCGYINLLLLPSVINNQLGDIIYWLNPLAEAKWPIVN